MRKWIVAALLALPLSAHAQTVKTFFGCGTFFCTTLTATVTPITPFEAYGETWTKHVSLQFRHEASAPILFKAHSYAIPQWATSTFAMYHMYDPIGWNSANFCAAGTPCNPGVINDGIAGPAWDGWDMVNSAVTAYRGTRIDEVPYWSISNAETVHLTLTPEPSTFVLSGSALLALGLLARRRRQSR